MNSLIEQHNALPPSEDRTASQWGRRYVRFYFVALFVGTAIVCLDGYTQHDLWRMGDWLIHYNGHFVRRGFLGSLILCAADQIGTNPGIIVLLLQIFLYAVIFLFSYKLLDRDAETPRFLMLALSPFLFAFQLHDTGLSCRKELLFFVALAVLTWAKVRDKRSDATFLLICACYPFCILTHEMLAVFLPYLFAIHAVGRRITRKTLAFYGMAAIPSIVATGAALAAHQATAEEVTAMHQNLQQLGYAIGGGALECLTWSIRDGFSSVSSCIETDGYLWKYPLITAIIVLGYRPIRHRLALRFLPALFVSVSAVGTIALFVVAMDWGRFLYINLFSLFFLALAHPARSVQQAPGRYSVLWLLWLIPWRLPGYGPLGIWAAEIGELHPIPVLQPSIDLIAEIATLLFLLYEL